MQFVDGTSITQLESILKHDKLRLGNTSGYTGVYQNRRTGKWVAKIVFKGMIYYLGSFDHKADAINARQEAEEKMFGAFLQWYYAREKQG